MDEKTLRKLMAALILQKRLFRLSDKVTYHKDTLAFVTDYVLKYIGKKGSITIFELRDELKVSRKYAQAIVEYLSGTGITRRDGDKHVLP